MGLAVTEKPKVIVIKTRQKFILSFIILGSRPNMVTQSSKAQGPSLMFSALLNMLFYVVADASVFTMIFAFQVTGRREMAMEGMLFAFKGMFRCIHHFYLHHGPQLSDSFCLFAVGYGI